jgi:hypothetical protein
MSLQDKCLYGLWSALASFAKGFARLFAKIANECEVMEIEATARATRYIK